MTDLTDKWKKGELPSGYYYVKNEFGNIFPSDYSEDYDNIGDTVIKDFFTEISEIKEVLEPVPSYEEWQSMDRLEKIMLQERARLNKQVIELLEENTQIKDLLKEIRGKLHYINTPKNRHNIFDNYFMKKIDEVLK